MKVKLAIALLFTIFGLHAQQLTFIDEESNESIPGVAVLFTEADGTTKSFISDATGSIELDEISLPATFKTQHVSYSPVEDILSDKGKVRFYLSPISTQLNDVVVTGQFAPTSAERSVFKVERILKEDFQARGAITLEDALKSQLNIDINQDLAIGSSMVSMQGISSQNVKILVDGIPLVNRNGNGNGADLSQINLQNIERIEIIEGPMAVNYGANALAGVINLITVDSQEEKVTGQIFLQSESAGNEIGFDKGRHIEAGLIEFGLLDKLNLQLSAQHNNFLGFQGEAGFRQHEWNPKRQYLTDAQLSYQLGEHQVKYKFGYLNELIKSKGRVQNNFLPSGENQPFAIDEEYLSERISHQLLFNGRTQSIAHYNAYISYSDFEREKSRFATNLVTNEVKPTNGEGDQDLSGFSVLDAGGSVNLNLSNSIGLQTGFQVTVEEAFGGRILSGAQQIEDYSLYSSLEWSIADNLLLRPGVRYSYNSAYAGQVVPSLQTKWDISPKDQLRFSYGQGFRAPSVRELYFEFIDSNHRIFGNPNLNPERSEHFSLNYSRSFRLQDQQVKTSVNGFYNDIDQQITVAQSPTDPTATSYLNIEKFRTLGINLTQSIVLGKLSGNLGASYIGRYNRISADETQLRPFFYTPEFTANFNYTLSDWATGLNLYYKYSGAIETYLVDDSGEVSIGSRDAFNWLDFSVNQNITKDISLLLGARNLLNIREINNSGVSTGAHGGGGAQPISYGRSYFIKLNYNIN